ncbi:hypothetical protein N9N67_07900 [Bacteriovoracaceae bacterium]|nr:hypothetical protein [Bacteriovoracaceae bacterium]
MNTKNLTKKFNFLTIIMVTLFLVSCGKERLNENRDDSDKANDLTTHPDTTDLNRLRSHFSKIYLASGNRPGDFIVHSGSDYTGNSNFATGFSFTNSVTYLNEFSRILKVDAVSRKNVQVRDVVSVSQGTNNFTFSPTSNFEFGQPYYMEHAPFVNEALGSGDPSLIYHSIKTVNVRFRDKVTGQDHTIIGSYIQYFDNSPSVSYYQNNSKGFVISSQIPFIANPIVNVRNGVVTGRLVQSGNRENFQVDGIDFQDNQQQQP